VKTFINTTDKTYTFSSCNDCPSKCCDGREGTIFSQLILEDFETVSKNFPIVFTFGELGYLKAVILFTDGTGFCPYIKNNQCSIYENRPSICRVYPLSPNLDNDTYIDDNCPAVDTGNGSVMVENGEVTKPFFYDTLENYQDKYIETHLELEKINDLKDFEEVINIKGISFFKYVGNKINQYITYHKISLLNNKKIIV
jgi:Fe-S-cluster containining protein